MNVLSIRDMKDVMLAYNEPLYARRTLLLNDSTSVAFYTHKAAFYAPAGDGGFISVPSTSSPFSSPLTYKGACYLFMPSTVRPSGDPVGPDEKGRCSPAYGRSGESNGADRNILMI